MIRISAEQFKKLPPHVQAMCVAVGDAYEMDPVKIEDVTGLKQAKQNEVEAHKLTKKELGELKTTFETTKTELSTFQELAKSNVPKANFDALEASYKAKEAQMITAHKAATDGLNGTLTKLLVDAEANRIAGEISTAPSLILPHIKARLSAEIDAEGNGKTRVLGLDGKPSALSLSDLTKEFVANKDYSAIMKATKSTGSGAPGGGAGSGAPGAQGQKPAFAGKSAKEIAAQLVASGAAPAYGQQ